MRRWVGRVAAGVASWATRPTTSGTTTIRELAPLTPMFDADQHQVYVDHLNAAVDAPEVRNIALTGRYGSGKSSILEQFAAQQAMDSRVLCLALSTLGPEQLSTPGNGREAAANSTTNRIEKELVKQLLHREKPSRLWQSRYQRVEVLGRARAIGESVAVVAALGVALWALGRLPAVAPESRWPVQVSAALVIGGIATALVFRMRRAVRTWLALSEFRVAGASVALTRTTSFFDEYLDEIMYFFEVQRSLDVVVFEDLDRFNDPGIFEALRELNTLLNSSRQVHRPVRFVYALRDSVFEKLGTEGMGDAAHVEVSRANRTKFFDLVIPIVPFITHRNARDLLTQVLQDGRLSAVPSVSTELVDLTARHIADMRLLINIRNEYAVFARRLITEQQGVESLQADQLFALIVYKNIHLADFEDLLLGRSRLDDLYQLSRRLVEEALRVRRVRLRELADETALPQALANKAERWGKQLSWYVEEIRKVRELNRNPTSLVLSGFDVAGTAYDSAAATSIEFWQAVGTTGAGCTVRFDRQGISESFEIDSNGIDRLLSDEAPADGWGRVERSDITRQRAQIESEVDALRTADFAELAEHPEFTISLNDEQRSFSDVLATTIESEVGRALIRTGHIDRYYTLYVAQYYGDHVPPNAMNFIRQNVDPNRSDVNYPLTDDEVAAVLQETKGAFLSERSAYNVAIVDYLFTNDPERSRSVLDTATCQSGDSEQAFLDAYIVEGAARNAAATYLASRWPRTFVYLATEADLTVDSRLELVSAALAGASPDVAYEFDNSVRGYLQSNYQLLPVVTRYGAMDDVVEHAIEQEDVRNAVAALVRSGVKFGDLSALSPAAIAFIVESDSYVLTNANLRTILGENAALSLDAIAKINGDVYRYCLQRPDEFLAALAADTAVARAACRQEADAKSETGAAWTIESPSAFAVVVADFVTHSGDAPVTILKLARPDCVVEDLGDVPIQAWPALAEARRICPTLANVDKYTQELGEVDMELATTLVPAGRVIEVPEDDVDAGAAAEGAGAHGARSRVASAILKAREVIPDPATRVALASSVGLGDWFALSEIEPEEGQLLGHLVAAGIWGDEAALIGHFANPGWESLCFAIQQSRTFTEYMTPALLDGPMATELLTSADISSEVKQALLNRFVEFVDATNCDALKAAGTAALATGTLLPVPNIASIAAGTCDSDLVVRLLDEHGTSIAAHEIVSTLAHLSSPYNQLGQSGVNLEFRRDPHHEAVLKRVQAAGLIAVKLRGASARKVKGRRIEVTVN